MESNLAYHCIIGFREHQWCIGETIVSPFKRLRDFSTWPRYKQCSEKLLENFRLKHHPYYPSRINCLFVCRSEESAKEWGMYKCRTSGCDNFYLYTLEILEGETYYCDTNWFEQLAAILSNGKIPFQKRYSVKDCVKGFWSGNNMRSHDTMLSEGLFKGKCIVTNRRLFYYNPIERDLKEIS